MSKSVDDLVEGISPSVSGGGCWAQKLDGGAVEFIEGVKAKEAQLGKPLHRGQIMDTLREHFGVTIGIEALTRHLKDRCRCVQA